MDTKSVPRMAKRQKKSFKEKKKGKDSLKVVYISSPMKVKTSASRFMSLVQELTGKNSDIVQYTELNDDKAIDHQFLEIDLSDGALVTQAETSDQYNLSSISNSNDTTTCNSSNSFFERVHDGLTSQMEDQFAGIFGSNSFCGPSLVDVLGNYDEL